MTEKGVRAALPGGPGTKDLTYKSGILLQPNSAARLLYESGVNVFPLIPHTKRPAITWEPFQNRKITEAEFEKFFPSGSNTNYAVICGQISGGLVIQDFETMEDFVAFYPSWQNLGKETLLVKTPHGGVHVYWRSLEGEGRHTRIFGQDHPMDFLGAGGYALGPGAEIDHSLCDRTKCHLTGITRYEVIGEVWTIADAGAGLFEATLSRGRALGWKAIKRGPSMKEIIKGGIAAGQRNETGFKYTRYLLFTVRLPLETAWFELRRWNASNKPPLDERELRTIFESAQHYTRKPQLTPIGGLLK
ncbi:MAG: bifunctional DNA primase/polymerase [Nitrososphaerota archaeon]|nr:bifunctional DNA primase/polymerase [Nitrososphaerota archaeon]MDG7048654.1 bifunctional DNA primase/polymerase [Nitrososphaerota archaeon]MDG7051153.1 bifunctional DNA primase/polymerase [Nitrososphaerota archaeon]